MQHWDTIAAERRTLADELTAFTPAQWEKPSLCGEWSVRQVVGHLVVPHEATRLKLFVEIAKDRGNFDRANSRMAIAAAGRPTADLVAALRRHAEGRFTPPGAGSVAPLTDVLIHGMDIHVPLGLPFRRSPEVFRHSLEFLSRRAVQRIFFSKRIPPLHLEASDLDWSHGSGKHVTGSAADLLLALSGRRARLDALDGPGAPAMADWVTT